MKYIMDQMQVIQNKIFHISAIVLICFGLASCSTKLPGSNSNNGVSGPIKTGSLRDFQVNVGNRVRFTTDSVELTQEARSILSRQAVWLNRFAQFSITLEGHADERGTREYNIALGARRAETVRRYLAGRGVNPARIRTISYGKERPVALCDNISCWSQNRRVVTLLNRRAGS